jgi:aryl-alcohol dehydrogenase-like predicted oxidoreductase
MTDLERRGRLGNTELYISPVAFGTSPLGGNFAHSEVDHRRLLAEVLELGINFIDTAPYYGDAEARVGEALAGRRDDVVLATKAGRYGDESFDHSPSRIRASLEESLRRLRTEYVDIFQLHDIEYVSLQPVLEDSIAELLALREEGKCRYVGATAFPIPTLAAAIRTGDLDVALTYAHATLLDDSATTELNPLADEFGVGLINAAAVALGLLTPSGTSLRGEHPATEIVKSAAAAMRQRASDHDVDVAFLANQYAIQRSGCVTTVVGSSRIENVQGAVMAASAPINEELLSAVLELRPPAGSRSWTVGRPENN